LGEVSAPSDRDDRVIAFEVIADAIHGLDGGFFGVRRVRLRNRRVDGSCSAEYECDFVVRPKGIDAVVVAIFHRTGGEVRVLLREGLRPALALGRAPEDLPVPDGRTYVGLTEVVAGIIEKGDVGEAGILQRAAIEVEEEAGLVVPAARVFRLGAATFPSPGSIPERYHLVAVEVDDPKPPRAPAGDGSPMEEGASIRWMALHDAIAACVRGEIEDAKTELALRRLAEHLRA
jgi:ADP-ribose pyrophosphatase